MSYFRITFSGHIRTVKPKEVKGNPAIEISLCRKNHTKDGEEPKFTWLNILVYKPAPWQIDQLKVGKFIAGSGEFTTRPFVDSNGVSRTASEVWCSSFDIDGPKPDDAPATPAQLAAAPSAPAKPGDEPPF